MRSQQNGKMILVRAEQLVPINPFGYFSPVDQLALYKLSSVILIGYRF